MDILQHKSGISPQRDIIPINGDVRQSIGSNIQMVRLSRGLTQTDLALAIGVSYQQVQKYELGRNRVPSDRLYDIALVLGVSVSSLYSGESLSLIAEPITRHDKRMLQLSKHLSLQQLDIVIDIMKSLAKKL